MAFVFARVAWRRPPALPRNRKSAFCRARKLNGCKLPDGNPVWGSNPNAASAPTRSTKCINMQNRTVVRRKVIQRRALANGSHWHVCDMPVWRAQVRLETAIRTLGGASRKDRVWHKAPVRCDAVTRPEWEEVDRTRHQSPRPDATDSGSGELEAHGGTKLGRKPLEDTDAAKVATIRAMRRKGTGIGRIARQLGIGGGTVLRITACA